MNREAPFSDLPAWRDAVSLFRAGNMPHCWAVSAPPAWHRIIFEMMAGLFLCDAGQGDDGCGGCRAWSRDESGTIAHPDLIVTGDFEKAPNIEACRVLIRDLPLKPVSAKRRLGVVLSADKLLVHAANSLLKIAEEPPSHACLLFLLEGSDFLPTLRSRSCFTTLAAPLSQAAKPAPRGEVEWLTWLESRAEGPKESVDISETLSAWISGAMQDGDVQAAARMDKLRLLVEQKKLSQAMVCDLLTLILKEELPFEHIFGGLR